MTTFPSTAFEILRRIRIRGKINGYMKYGSNATNSRNQLNLFQQTFMTRECPTLSVIGLRSLCSRLGPKQLSVHFSTASSSQANKTGFNARPTKRTIGLPVLLVPFLVTTGLGIWQVKRLFWKMDLIEQRRLSLEKESFALFDPQGNPNTSSIADMEFQKVSVRGKFITPEEFSATQADQQKPDSNSNSSRKSPLMLVGPRPPPPNVGKSVKLKYSANGYYAVAPIRMQNGQIALVNLGWTPKQVLDTVQVNNLIQDGRETTFEGVLRLSECPNKYVPDNVVEKNEWFWIDIDAMVQRFDPHFTYTSFVIEQLEEKSELENASTSTARVKPRELSDITFPCKKQLQEYLQFYTDPSVHVAYATTWFGLAFCIGMYAFSIIKRNRLAMRKVTK